MDIREIGYDELDWSGLANGGSKSTVAKLGFLRTLNFLIS